MKHLLQPLSLLLLLLLAVTSCKKTPEYVIAEDKMEQLLVDIHLSEGYIERVLSRPSKDKKEQVRSSIFEKHQVTQAQFDTSLMWYGKNLEVYMSIYDRVIATLKQQNNVLKGEISKLNAQVLTAPGDSVNVWKGDPYYIFASDVSKRLLTFNVVGDVNFKKGDKFIFSARLNTITAGVATTAIKPIATLGISYKGGDVVSVSNVVEPNGIFELNIDTEDKTIDNVFGSLFIPLDGRDYVVYTDSIEVLRIHK